jgi:hypothetical protein
MSEYQYYEFQAIDRPLNERATAARARHLDSLARREEELWRQVETAIQTKQPKEYDHAIDLLKGLRDLAERTNTGEDFSERIRELRERHRSKPSLMQRLDRAELRT